jgi:microcystin-dependent protein
MSEPFLGQIRVFGFNFPPRDWAQCDGQLLPIADNEALFSLLGTTYGGDGRTTFGLPDFRGRTPAHEGSGYPLGDRGGSESVLLTVAQLPAHTHAIGAANGAQDSDDPAGAFPGQNEDNTYNSTTSPTLAPFATDAIPVSGGGGQGHQNMQPYLVLNVCIALQGIFPSRN